MSSDSSNEKFQLRQETVKKFMKEVLGADSSSISTSSIELMSDITAEFIRLIALAGIDRSEHPNMYCDSNGIISALRDLGFESIADQIPLNDLPEDLIDIK